MSHPAKRTFDRIVHFDERSRSFPIRALLEPQPKIRKRHWRCDTWNDQQAEGACVGFAWSHELASTPKVHTTSAETARGIYKRAQLIDQWPGEHYEGTSVLAGAKVVMEMGLIREYRWAFGLNDVLAAISNHGPVVFGLNWYRGMFEPDQRGYLHPEGEQVGGHAILGRGVDPAAERVLLHNSWGFDWGRSGTAFISFQDLDRLLREDGEACVPVYRK